MKHRARTFLQKAIQRPQRDQRSRNGREHDNAEAKRIRSAANRSIDQVVHHQCGVNTATGDDHFKSGKGGNHPETAPKTRTIQGTACSLEPESTRLASLRETRCEGSSDPAVEAPFAIKDTRSNAAQQGALCRLPLRIGASLPPERRSLFRGDPRLHKRLQEGVDIGSRARLVHIVRFNHARNDLVA